MKGEKKNGHQTFENKSSGKPVGVIQPSRWDGEVAAGTLRHIDLFQFFLFLRSGLFQIFANHVLFLSLL